MTCKHILFVVSQLATRIFLINVKCAWKMFWGKAKPNFLQQSGKGKWKRPWNWLVFLCITVCMKQTPCSICVSLFVCVFVIKGLVTGLSVLLILKWYHVTVQFIRSLHLSTQHRVIVYSLVVLKYNHSWPYIWILSLLSRFSWSLLLVPFFIRKQGTHWRMNMV